MILEIAIESEKKTTSMCHEEETTVKALEGVVTACGNLGAKRVRIWSDKEDGAAHLVAQELDLKQQTTVTTVPPSDDTKEEPIQANDNDEQEDRETESEYRYCAETEFYRPSRCSKGEAESYVSEDTMEQPNSYRSLFDQIEPVSERKFHKLVGLLRKRVTFKFGDERDSVAVRSFKSPSFWEALVRVLTLGWYSHEKDQVENILVEVEWYGHDAKSGIFRTPNSSAHPAS